LVDLLIGGSSLACWLVRRWFRWKSGHRGVLVGFERHEVWW